MAYTVNKVDVWTCEIDDRVGGLAEKLEPLAAAKVDLSFVLARRQAHIPGKGVVFLAGIKGAKGMKAAAAAGLAKATDLVGLRVEGPNKAGDCHKLTRVIADAGITLRGLTASVIGNKYAVLIAFDNAADADNAAKLIRAAGKKK